MKQIIVLLCYTLASAINTLISHHLDWYLQSGIWNENFKAVSPPPGSPI